MKSTRISWKSSKRYIWFKYPDHNKARLKTLEQASQVRKTPRQGKNIKAPWSRITFPLILAFGRLRTLRKVRSQLWRYHYRCRTHPRQILHDSCQRSNCQRVNLLRFLEELIIRSLSKNIWGPKKLPWKTSYHAFIWLTQEEPTFQGKVKCSLLKDILVGFSTIWRKCHRWEFLKFLWCWAAVQQVEPTYPPWPMKISSSRITELSSWEAL